MKRALVTGATGFAGRHLVARLMRDGRQVHVIARESSDVSRLTAGDKLIIHKFGGTTKGLVEILREADPSTIFHLASLVMGDHQIEDVRPMIESNVLFGAQLLEAAVQSSVPCFINTGTFWQHYKGPSYDPVCLYAATKQALQDILKFYIEAHGLPAVTLKLFDVYGPKDRRGRLFSLLKEADVSGRVLAMSPGEQLSDFIYIDDVVDAYLAAEFLLTEDQTSVVGRDYAVSSGQRLPLREVISLYEDVIGRRLPINWGGRSYRPREVMDPWEGEWLPGWRPKVDLREGIRRLAAEDDDVRPRQELKRTIKPEAENNG